MEIRLTEPVTNEADSGVLIGSLDQMLAKLEGEEKLGDKAKFEFLTINLSTGPLQCNIW